MKTKHVISKVNKYFNFNDIMLFLLILLGAFLHFYNLNWGAPFYFHPDERNIASAVSQLQFPGQMNPHFFAYGSLPIYIIYFTGVLVNAVQSLIFNLKISIYHVSFEQAIIISRCFSALFATLLIPLLFVLMKKICVLGHPEFISGSTENKPVVTNNIRSGNGIITGLLAAFLTATSVGFIQFAHFGTFEMWLTFFTVILFWLSLLYLEQKKNIYILYLGIIFGVLIATKVSHIVLLLAIVLTFIFNWKSGKTRTSKKHLITESFGIFRNTVLLLLVSVLIYCISNPYVFLDFQSFIASMHYESSVALGTMPVFYTGGFENTIPVLYQFLHVYPFLLNPITTILFIPSFIYFCFLMIKQKNTVYLLLTFYFLILIISQAFLYVKWTRYMVPTLPFMYMILAIAATNFMQKKAAKYSIMIIVLWLQIIFACAYFITAFVEPDTRIQAVQAAKGKIPSQSNIISEVYDLGIVPFNPFFPHLTLFNFYELDNNSPEFNTQTLRGRLTDTEYIILPSQRVYKTRLTKEKNFPSGHAFYSSLFSGSLGYVKIYETPCDVFCKITYINNPVYAFEETANVFDRPTVIIFKKIK